HSLALIACRSCLRHPLSSRLPYTTLFRSIDAPSVMPAERLAALRQVQLADSVGTEMWLGRAALESEAGSLDSAATYLERYIREGDRKSTRLNSSHVKISYAVFCLKKKKH